MSYKSVACFLTGCALSLVNLTGFISPAIAQQPVRFICEEGVDPQDNQTYPTTYAVTDRGKIPLIHWNYKWFGDKDIILQGRCQTVSSSFQAAYNNGSLSYITNSKDGGQPVICSTGRFLGTCVTVLLALRSSEDSFEVLGQLKEVLRGESSDLPLPRFTIIPQMYVFLDMDQLLATTPVDN